MPINVSLWKKNNLYQTKVPDHWHCPVCDSSNLKIDKFSYEETGVSKRNHEHPDFEPEYMSFRFTSMLKCQKPSCQEVLSCNGTGHVQEVHELDPDGQYSGPSYTEVFQPKYVIPPLNLFDVPKCPDGIGEMITDAFGLYFCDLSSCANKIRTVIEKILDQQNVIKTRISKKKKRNLLTLHARIFEFRLKNQDAADMLLAIKWIGNEGSHLGSLEQDDILDAFAFLEHLLDLIYVKTHQKLLKRSRQINKAKVPMSRQRRSAKTLRRLGAAQQKER